MHLDGYIRLTEGGKGPLELDEETTEVAVEPFIDGI